MEPPQSMEEGPRHSHVESSVLVPVPVPCLCNISEGSTLAQVTHGNGNLGILSRDDVIRIHHPYFSSSFQVSRVSATEITLSRPYDHSPIIEKEELAKDDTIERLYCPYGKEKSEKRVLVCTSNHHSSCRGAEDHDNKKREAVSLIDARVWKLIPCESDLRPPWRRQYDDGDAPHDYDFASSQETIRHFGIDLKESVVEKLCKDAVLSPEQSIHQQRVLFFDKVSVDFVVRETFRIVSDWHPACNSIDNVKWAKLSRKMGFLSSIRNTSHEIDMAFLRRCHDRKLNLARFHAILEDVALMQYLRLDCRMALKRLLWNTVVMLPYVNEKIWSEAKALAMAVEAKRVCAQIRLAANFRRIKQRTIVIRMVDAATCIAKYVRRRIAVMTKCRILDMIKKDLDLRRLIYGATICQTAWRRYQCRKAYLERKRHLIQQERQRALEYRRKLTAEQARRDATIVCRFARCVQGVHVVVTMSLDDESFTLAMKVYVPMAQRTFEFCFDEETLQSYMQQISEREGSMSWNEMLEPKFLQSLADRLMVRRVKTGPIILFSKRNMAEKGRLVAKKVIKTNEGDEGIFLLSIYKSSTEFIFCIYDPGGCDLLRTSLSHSALRNWLSDEDNIIKSRHPSPIGSGVNGPSLALLRPERQDDLVAWLSTRILVVTTKKTGRRRLLFQFEADKEKAERLACRIQSVVRKLAARARARRMVREQFEKAFHRNSGSYYYTSSKTGMCQWTKPLLLGEDELEAPRDEWRRIDCPTTNTTSDGRPTAYYHNPATGQTSWLSVEDAARMLQRRVRERQASDILGPKPDMATIARAVKFISDAEAAFEAQPERLSHKVNYALTCHCLRFDFDRAREQYEQAFSRCPSHPIIARAYAILMLAACDMPRDETVQRALGLFKEADIGDPSARMFRVAIQNCFVWAVIVHPQNPLTLLNSALLHQYVLKDHIRADKLYRRALSIDPKNESVSRNYELFTVQH